MSENEVNITMDSELMLPLRTDIDSILSKTLKTMHTYGNGEAVVNAKIKITLSKEALPTSDGSRPIIKPKFEHEVSSVVQSKDKKSGSMFGEYELVYDQDTDSWVARSTKQQLSMFDPEAQNGESCEEEPKGLPAPVQALPAEGTVSDDDDDFTEADAYEEDESEPDSEDPEDEEE